MDAGREMQLRRVLHERGDEYVGRFAELKYLLAPYVVTSAAEQRRFYRLWDDYVAELDKRTESSGPASETDEPTPRWKNILWGLVVAFLVFAAGMIGYYTWSLIRDGFFDEKPPIVRVNAAQEAEVRAGQPLQVANRTLLERPQDSVGFRWEITDADGGEILYERDSFNLDYLVPADFAGRKLRLILRNDVVNNLFGSEADTLELAVLCADPPLLLRGEVNNEPLVLGDKRTFSVEAQDGVAYVWIIDGDTLAGPQVQYEFLTEGQSRVQVLARNAEDGEYCYTLSRPQTIQVGSNLPEIPSIPLKKDTPRQLLTVSGWLYWLPLLFGLYLYWLHRQRWKKRAEEKREKTDEELAIEYPFHDVGPYVIPYQDQSGQISVPADFYRIADQLRVREEGVRMTFDGRATVEATIREGGFPAWRERAVKRPATYLVLLKHTDEYQQQDRLLKRLTDFLVAREAALEVYYHGGEFGWFWNEAHPKGWSAAQLRSRYGEHRLIVLGHGHGLTDNLHRGKPRLSPAKERWLHSWARRLLLTTEPVTDWSFQEVLLHEHLLLFPATTDGILRGVADLNQVEEYQAGAYPRWKAERLRRDPEPSYRYRTWDDVADHRDYLADDPDLFRWLTALAVAPHPDWSLTIAIGRALGLDVTHDRLLRLSRIPWLATNAPDQDLRLDFLALLDPTDEKLARAAVLELLELVSNEVAGTFAETEWTATQAVQNFALAPQDAENQGKIKELQRVGLLAPDQLDELDLVASREFPATKGGYQPTEDGTPAYLDKLLNPPAEIAPRFTAKDKELLGMIFACLLLVLPLYLYDKAQNELAVGNTPSWWQNVENPTDDDHLAIVANNLAVQQADYLARAADYAEYTERTGQVGARIISALDSAKQFRPEYPLADSNLTRHYLNDVATRLNWMIEGSYLPTPDILRATEVQLAGLRSRIDSLHDTNGDYMLQTHHMNGLYRWYRYREGGDSTAENSGIANQQLTYARRTAALIDSLNPVYFDTLREGSMPIHLRNLLAREPQSLVDFIDRVYSGRVVDQNGNPISGVDVVVAGTQRGVLTVNGGYFRIAPQMAEGNLLVSYQNGLAKEVNLLNEAGLPLTNTDLGDLVIFVPQSSTTEVVAPKWVTGNIINAKTKDPVVGAAVELTSGSRSRSLGEAAKTVTNEKGIFRLGVVPGAEGIVVSWKGKEIYSIPLGSAVGFDGTLLTGTISIELPELQGTEQTSEGEDNAFLLERMIDRFGDNRYSRILERTGTAEESVAFVEQLTGKIGGSRLLQPIVEGDDLIETGTKVSNGYRHDREGSFLFVKPRRTPGAIGDKVDRLHRGSNALVVIGTDFADNDTPQDNLSSVGSASEKFADALEADGFNVTRLRNPTKYELDQSISSFANADYSATSQLLVYLSGYHDGEQLYVKDNFAGLMSGFMLDETLEDYLRELDARVPHLLVVKNYTDGGSLPEGTGDDEAFWPDMVPVIGGAFQMGDTFGDSEQGSNEGPVHTVTVSPFEMGRFEVTFAEYDRFTEATGKAQAKADFGRGQQPVINVSWFDAISYCNWLSKIAEQRPAYSLANRKKQLQWEAQDYGLELADDEEIVIDWNANGYRLSTEAEWEFAASYADGRRKARFGNGRDTLRPQEANFYTNADFKAYSEMGVYRERTVPVGSLDTPNLLGIHDLSGNVSEWCWDWYGRNYYSNQNARRNPNGPEKGTDRVIRGGSWYDYAGNCRNATRSQNEPTNSRGLVGFRLARSSR